jgi:hypothetical protein
MNLELTALQLDLQALNQRACEFMQDDISRMSDGLDVREWVNNCLKGLEGRRLQYHFSAYKKYRMSDLSHLVHAMF